MQKKLLFLACFFAFIESACQQYPMAHYTPKDGLVNSRVRKSYQDSKGRLYFITYGGLSVYDGARFRNYTTQNGLSSDLINDVIEIGEDTILIATNGGGLNVLTNGKISLLRNPNGLVPVGNNFYKRNTNETYIAGDHGLYLFKDYRCTELNTRPTSQVNGIGPYFGNITGVGNYLIIGSNELRSFRGLFLYDIANNRICDAMPDTYTSSMSKDHRERVWISLQDQLYMLDSVALKRGKLSLIRPPAIYNPVISLPTNNMTFNKAGGWFIYQNRMVIRIDEAGGSVRIPLPEQVMKSGISHIRADEENSIWLCNDGAGIFKIVNSSLRIFDNPTGQPMQALTVNATCFKESTWFSTSTNQLIRKTSQNIKVFIGNNRFAPVVYHQAGNKVMAYDVRNLYEGNLNEANSSIHFTRTASLPDTNTFGKKLRTDSYGNTIAIMTSGLGVWKNNKLVYTLPVYINDLVEEFAFDRNNLLWVVRRYKEVEAFSLHPDQPNNYLQLKFRFARNTDEGSPRCFLIDKTGLFWIGTREHGLFVYRYNGKELIRIAQFNTGNGLMDNFITVLSCDSLNNIIAGTQTGLDRIIRESTYAFRIENLTKSGNFFAYITEAWTDINNQSYALTNTGQLLQVSPSPMSRDGFTPKLFLEEMRVNGQRWPLYKTRLSYKQNNISFSLAAPSFIDEKQIRFAYLLSGSGNGHWSDTSSSHATINLSNLSAGKYQLKTRAFFSSTSYQPAESSFSFEIKAPWWQTWWFSTAMAMLGIGILVAAFRFYYRRKLGRQKVVLEKKQAIEKERTRIATDMHDDLGAGLSRIKFLSETIGIKKQQQQPIEEDISKIREYSHEMIDKMGEIVWALNEKNDSLNDLLSYTRSYAVEYLSQHGIRSVVTLPEHLPSRVVSGEFRRNIFLAVKETLHNVVKHSQAANVTIAIHLDRELAIRIQDDGIGFDPANTRPYSNGITNIDKRMKDIGGTMRIENNKGTAVELSAPLPL